MVGKNDYILCTCGMWPLKYNMAAFLPYKIKAQALESTLGFSSRDTRGQARQGEESDVKSL